MPNELWRTASYSDFPPPAEGFSPSSSFVTSFRRSFPNPIASNKAAGWGSWTSDGLPTTTLHTPVAYTAGQEKFQTTYTTTGYSTWSNPPRPFSASPFRPPSESRVARYGAGSTEHGTSLLDGPGAIRTRGSLPESEEKRVWSQRSVKEMADFGSVPTGLPRGERFAAQPSTTVRWNTEAGRPCRAVLPPHGVLP